MAFDSRYRDNPLKSNLNFKIEGIKDVEDRIKKLGTIREKRAKILMILRRQMKPIEAGVRQNTPESDRDHTRKDRNGNIITIPKGNLKKSIGIKTSKNKTNPTVMVGPRAGRKAKYDGFYGWWHIYGWSPWRGPRIEANDFIWDGAAPLMDATESRMSDELTRYIERQIKLNKL